MTPWKALPLSLVLVVLPALAPAAAAHPPAGDPHNSCVGLPVGLGPLVPMAPVPAVNSYVTGPTGTLPCSAPGVAEFGSHEGPCPPPPFVGVVGNKFCGPLVPPGGAATCSWRLLAAGTPLAQGPIALVVGFDLTLEGFITAFAGEFPVTPPLPPGDYTVPNPFPVPGRVIAYPTDALLAGAVLPLPIPTVVGC